MSRVLQEAVVVAYGRTAVAKAIKGSLKDAHPVDYAAEVLKGVLAKVPQLDPMEIEDLVIGTSTPEQKLGSNVARLIAVRAGLPYEAPAHTINRFCSSGLQSISTAANSIMTGQAEVMIAGGVEVMNYSTTSFPDEYKNAWLLEHAASIYMPMGVTAERVATKYGVTREDCDAFAVESHLRATAAQKAGKFAEEIIPVQVEKDGAAVTFDTDECIRPTTNMEGLGKLESVFEKNGVVTAGNSSQLSDGAAIVILMSRRYAENLGVKPIARFVGFAVGGVDPEIMGIGPIVAIPKVLKQTGLSLNDMDVIELNEAFATQSLVCIRELGLNTDKVNPNGGAIALGHPLGATGSILTCKVLAELGRTGGRYGMVTMCIGGGMGAAGIYEML